MYPLAGSFSNFQFLILNQLATQLKFANDGILKKSYPQKIFDKFSIFSIMIIIFPWMGACAGSGNFFNFQTFSFHFLQIHYSTLGKNQPVDNWALSRLPGEIAASHSSAPRNDRGSGWLLAMTKRGVGSSAGQQTQKP